MVVLEAACGDSYAIQVASSFEYARLNDLLLTQNIVIDQKEDTWEACAVSKELEL